MSAENFPEDIETDELRQISDLIQAADNDVTRIRTEAAGAIELSKRLDCEAGDTDMIRIVQRARRYAFQVMGVDFERHQQNVLDYGSTTYDQEVPSKVVEIAREFVKTMPTLELSLEENRALLCVKNEYPEPNIVHSAFCITAFYTHKWLESLAADTAKTQAKEKILETFLDITGDVDIQLPDEKTIAEQEEALVCKDTTVTPEGIPLPYFADELALLSQNSDFIEIDGEVYNLPELQGQADAVIQNAMRPLEAGRVELVDVTKAILRRFNHEPVEDIKKICHQARCLAYMLAGESMERLGTSVDTYWRANPIPEGEWADHELAAREALQDKGAVWSKLLACLERLEPVGPDKDFLALACACITLKQIEDYKVYAAKLAVEAEAKLKAARERVATDQLAAEILKDIDLTGIEETTFDQEINALLNQLDLEPPSTSED